jgi:hypothetical protein
MPPNLPSRNQDDRGEQREQDVVRDKPQHSAADERAEDLPGGLSKWPFMTSTRYLARL